MKLHLPSPLRKALMSCLALSLNCTIATTLTTGAIGIGCCLISIAHAEEPDAPLEDIVIGDEGTLTMEDNLTPESFADGRTTLSYEPSGREGEGRELILQGTVSGFTEIHVPSNGDAAGKITFDSMSHLGGSGTLTKTGAGLLTLGGEVEFEGILDVKEGAVQWGTGETSQVSWKFNEVKLNEGTELIVKHASVHTETKLTMDNATLTLGSVTGSPDPVEFGQLTISGDNSLNWVEGTAENLKNAGFRFAGLTGKGNLTVVTPFVSDSTAETRTLDFGDVYNFHGVIITSMKSEYASSWGMNFGIGTVHQDAGYAAKWQHSNGYGIPIYSNNFRKTGEGSLTLSGNLKLSVNVNGDFWMRYEGDLNLENSAKMSITFGEGSILHYEGDPTKSIMDKVSDYILNGVVYVNADEIAESELTADGGLNLQLSSDYYALVKVQGTRRYRLFLQDNMVHLELTGDNNWSEGIEDANKDFLEADFAAPVADSVGNFGIGLAENQKNTFAIFDAETQDVVNDKEKNNIFGGSAKLGDKERRTVIDGNGVGIKVLGGDWNIVAGGNYAHNEEAYSVVGDEGETLYFWTKGKGGYARDFVGDVHIFFGSNEETNEKTNAEQPKAAFIVGGNYGNSVAEGRVDGSNKKAIATSFTGNTHISIYSGDVDWVCGGSYQTVFDFIHGAYNGGRGPVNSVVPDINRYNEGTFMGDSNIFVYTVLTGVKHNNSAGDFVAGGNMIDIADSLATLKRDESGDDVYARTENLTDFHDHIISTPFYFIGDSYVVVDLTSHDRKSGNNTFGKSIVGGDYARNEKGWAEHLGNSYVYITGAEGITFTERIFGGNYDDGSSYTHLSGSSWVKIDSGIFETMVVAGSNQGSLDEDKAVGKHFRKALFCTVGEETRVEIHGGVFTGLTSTITEKMPGYVMDGGAAAAPGEDVPVTQAELGDANAGAMVPHSLGRISVVGGNYIARAANAERQSCTVNIIEGGTYVDISGGTFSGHIFGATVIEGNNGNRAEGGLDEDWMQPVSPNGNEYLLSYYYEGFRAHLLVGGSKIVMRNATMHMTALEDDSDFTPDIWSPRVVGGYLIHLAADNLVPNLMVLQNDDPDKPYKPQIKIGEIDVSVSDCAQVYDVIGGSWTACLDVSADEVRDWRDATVKDENNEYIPVSKADPNDPSLRRDENGDIINDDIKRLGVLSGTITFTGVEQGNVKVRILGKTKVTGDVVAGGIQGGISKIVSDSTTVEIGSDVVFDMYPNPYRPKNNVITGGYMSVRRKDESACRDMWMQKLPNNPDAKMKWDDEQDPFDTFYEAAAYLEENQNTGLNVSYVKGDRRLDFSSPEHYGENIFNSILLNFDYVRVNTKACLVRAAGLLITDTQDWKALEDENGENPYLREAITLYGGGEMQLSPDYMLVPEWIVPEGETSHTVPAEADRYKWLHNNSYTIVTDPGTTLRLLAREREGRDGWIMNGVEYTDDNLLHVQKLWVKNGAHLAIEQHLDKNSIYKVNAQPVAVRNYIKMDVTSAMTHMTNISLNEMRTREDAAIRRDVDVSDLRMDKEGNRLDGISGNVKDSGSVYTVIFEDTKVVPEKPSYKLHIDRVESSFYQQDKFRRYLIDYVNPEAFNSLWAKEFGKEITDTKGSISYDKYTQEMLDKWFAKSEHINGYDKYRIRVKDNDDGTFSLVLEGMRVTPDPDDPTIPDPPAPGKTPGYHKKRARSHGGKAGGSLLDEYYPDPSDNSPDREDVLDRIFELNVDGRTDESDRLQAAVAGSSIAALGVAFSDDLDRQLRLMRNRATKNLSKPGFITRTESIDRGKAGIDIHQYPEYMPPKRYGLWVNGEGDFRSIDGKQTDPGYRMNSWGGTVGGSYSVTDDIEVGLALTAMYGDFRSKGPDVLKGDMDTKYLSAFARYDRGHWSHSFISTFGLVDVDATRTVNIGGEYGSYTTRFSTDGYAIGLMYEVGYTFELNEEKTLTLQPIANISWRHTLLNGFTETGSDAALRVGDQKSDMLGVGVGARAQALVGSESMNRDFLFELRALAKSGFGKSYNMVEVGFADRNQRAKVRSRKLPSIGVEIGGGVTVPLTPNTATWEHAIFMDVNLEIFGAMRNANFTVGYKLSF